MNKSNYRPDIDGLRAVAVLGVIFYHLDIIFYSKRLLPGGFVGVDIFFVISGFLITKIIYNNLQTNTFSFVEFYVKRIKRIIPLLFFIILISIFFFYPILYRDSFDEYIKSLLATILFSSNLFFYFQDSYWGEPAIFKPFLHTWSLGVEEQFYIIYPLILIYLYKNRFNNIKVLLSIAIVSFILLLYCETFDKDAIFYLIFFRIWEFIVGSIAVFIVNNTKEKYSLTTSNLFNAIGLILILISFLIFYPEEGNYYKLIMPVAGAFFIILFYNKNSITYKLLSNKILVFIGLISYSLYLWHQPIFVYYRLKHLDTITIFIKLYLLVFVFILSFLSWKYIEQPFRKNILLNFKVIKIYIYSTIVLFIILFFLLNHKVFPQKVSLSSEESVLIVNKKNCRVGPCDAGDINSDIKIAVVGDFHSAMLMSPIDDYLKKLGIKATYYTVRLDQPDLYKNTIDHIIDNNFTTIVIGFNYILRTKNNYLDFSSSSNISIGRDEGGIKNIEQQNISMKKIVDTIKELSKNTNHLVLIHQVPESGWHNVLLKMNKSIESKIQSNSYNPNIPIYFYLKNSTSIYKERTKIIERHLNEIQKSNIIHIKPYSLFCDNFLKDYCVLSNEKKILYWDTNHLSKEGATILVNKVFREFEIKKGSKMHE